MQQHRMLSMALLCLLLGSSQALAQRRVTGQVTALGTGEPLGNVSVNVEDASIGAYTEETGRFTLSVPESDVTLLFRRIGYKQNRVVLAPGQTEVNVQLEADFFRLQEQVITGEATSVARVNVANDITTISADELLNAPAQTVEAALQGKVPGAIISSNSGAPGGGMQVSLRGITTINASIDPLYIIDGVVVSNDAIASGTNAVTSAAGGSNASNQDNPVNRIADINPANIERIEILKGASASAIYGSRAANGVVIITTKGGRPGPPQFSLTQRFGTYQLSNKFGARDWTVDEAISTFGSVVPEAEIRAQFANGRQDFEEQLFGENDLSFETNLSIRGGTDATRYFVSGLVRDDAGIMEGTGYEKQGFRANLNQSLGERVTVDVNTYLVHSLARRGLSNNDNAGVSYYMVLPFTPNFFDLRPENGVYPLNPFERSNPFQTRDLSSNEEDVYRVIGSASVQYDVFSTPSQRLFLRLDGGIDQFSQENSLLYPPDLFFEPTDDGLPGTAVLGNSANVNTNYSLTGTHSWFGRSGSFTATTSAGLQRLKTEQSIAQTITRDLFASQGNIDQGSVVEVFENRQRAADLAFFAQEEVLTFDDRLLVTVAARAERTTNNGDIDKFYLFPKASASYRFPEVVRGVDEFKLRAAFGQSGNQPLYGMKFTTFATGNYAGALALQPGLIQGDADIQPERQTEIEGGFDAVLFGERASLSVTAYEKTIDDLILQRTAAPSTGFTTELFNGGQLRNRGLEIGLGLTPVVTSSATWFSRVTYAHNRSKVTELPVPEFQVGGFGTVLGAFQIEEGKSATQIVGRDGSEVVVVGDAAPDFQMAFSNDITWNRFRLFSLFDWKKGGDILNLTRLLADFGANSPDFCIYIDPSDPSQGCDPDRGGLARISQFGSKTALYIEDAGYVKLRELTLSYSLPEEFIGTLFGGRTDAARIELSGRNLYTWTDYSGVDPEVSNFGNQAIARNIDVAPYPPSRSYFFTIAVDF
ncbi:MAG: SusC/RagA family TonB-linked outer membrane protein [Gemmatimonadaceae bacterium]